MIALASEIAAPGPSPMQDLGDPEVGEIRVAVLGEEDILRLHVAVDDPATVGVVERTGDRREDGDHLRSLEAARLALGVEMLVEIAAIDVLHHQIDMPIMLADIVNGQDMGVLQSRHRARLALETLGIVRLVRQRRGQDLDRDRPLEDRIEGAIDGRHPPRPSKRSMR